MEPPKLSPEPSPEPGLNGPHLWRHLLPVPRADGHKHDRGHALVFSGGPSSTGAARLAAGAALRCGAGLVTLVAPGAAMQVAAGHLTAVMLRRCDGAGELAGLVAATRARAAVIGPGFGLAGARADTLRAMVLALAKEDVSLVLDADALTAFQDDPPSLFDAIAARRAATVLTPHAGEYARLFPDRPAVSQAAVRSRSCIILKGARTLVAAPQGALLANAHATPWLATAGSGDTLCGILAGFLAGGMAPFHAACAAVWVHGEAGRRCAPWLTAEDLEPALRPTLAALTGDGSAG